MRRVFVCCLLLLMTCTLLHATTVKGKVYGPDMRPIANAQVFAFTYTTRDSIVHVATNNEGAFSLDATEPTKERPLFAVVSFPGYAITNVKLEDTSASTIVMEKATPFYAVLLTGNNVPVPGVRVYITGGRRNLSGYYSLPKLLESFSTVSDAHGHFTFDNLPADGEVSLVPGDSRFVGHSSPVRLPTTREKPYQFVVRLAGSIYGRVVDGNGKPIARAKVSNDYNQTVTAADGTFHLSRLPAGKFPIAITDISGQWVQPAPLTATIKEGVKTDLGTIKCCRGGMLSGTVRDAETKQPIAGVRIKCPLKNNVPFFADEGITTNAQGHYQLRLSPGKHEFLISSEKYSGPQPRVTSLEVANGTQKTIDITMQKKIAANGTVVDGQGKPLAGIILYLLGRDEEWHGPIRIESDASGRFTTPAMARDTRVRLSTAPSRKAVNDWEVVSPTTLTFSKTMRPLTVVLCRAPRGRVVSTTGAPIPGATVHFRCEQTEYDTPNSYTRSEYPGTVITDAQGEYVLPNLRLLTAIEILDVKADGARTQHLGAVGTAGGAIVNISDTVMQLCDAEIHGMVLDETGTPVAGAAISTLDSPSPCVTSDAHGRFTLAGLPPGETCVLAVTPSASAMSKTTTGAAPITLTLRHNVTTTGIAGLLTLLQQDQRRSESERRLDHSAMLGVLAEYDFAQAAREAQAEGLPVMETMHAAYLRSLIAHDLQQAAVAGPTELEYLYTPMLRCDLALELGFALAHRAPNVAEHCCSLAEGVLRAEKTAMQDDRYFRVALLAAWTHHPELPQLLAMLRTQTKKERGFEAMARYYVVLEESNSPQAAQVWKSMNANMQRAIVEDFIPYAYRGTPEQASRLIARVNASYHAHYKARALDDDEIRQLAKSNPAEALKRVQPRLNDWNATNLVITVASAQPRDKALMLYRQLLENRGNYYNCSGNIEIIARAFALDPAYGNALYQQMNTALARNLANQENLPDDYYQEWNLASYAYFYSRIDPQQSRILLEQSYQRMLTHAKERKWMQESLAYYPLAMVPIDLERAQQMLAEIGQRYPYVLAEANRKLANYLIGDEETRMTLFRRS